MERCYKISRKSFGHKEVEQLTLRQDLSGQEIEIVSRLSIVGHFHTSLLQKLL